MDNLLASPVAFFIFLLTIATSLLAFSGSTGIMQRFILHPYTVVRQRRYYTLLTSGLIHADVPHLLFNMITFYFFVFPLEYFMGHGRFLALYVAGLIFSSLPSVIKHRDDPKYMALGASGAVTAALFSCIIYVPTASIYLMFIPIPIPAPLFAVLYVGFSYYSARSGRQTRIGHTAHLWGAITGLVMTLLLDWRAYPHFFQKLQQMLG